ncbi:MAG: magnesium-translocating P-type ATPase [Acidiferrobacteraceae bacterium]
MGIESVIGNVRKRLAHIWLPDRRNAGARPHPGITALFSAASSPVEALYDLLGTRNDGLTSDESDTRLEQHGRNEIVHEKPPTWYLQLLKAFNNPFILLLLLLALVSIFSGDFASPIVIGSMVLVSVILRFVQEFRSTQAAEQLKAMVSTTATVRRHRVPQEGQRTLRGYDRVEIPMARIVPGDIVQLSAGDMIPADVRLIYAKDLFVSQAVLTGESLPVEKIPAQVEHPPLSALDLPNICYMGSNVISGAATALVIATGDHAYLGSLAQTVVGRRPLTEFERGVNGISWLLIRFMLVMVPIVFLINGITKHDWFEAFLFALSVAVGLTPEMLPMIVTATLARGAVSMSRKKVIVKRLSAIQNFGAMDILCTDKTGTITQNRIILEKHVDAEGQDNEAVIQYAYLNSFHQTGLKNLLDRSILEHVEIHNTLNVDAEYSKVDEIPFDFARRRMSVVVQKDQDLHTLICKGAVEEVLAISDRVETGGVIRAIDDGLRATMRHVVEELNEDGLRVIAVAYKDLPASRQQYSVRDETGLVLLGYMAFLDPPKETAEPAIRALRGQGVSVKILTGDNDVVTRKICRQVGLTIEDVVLGSDVDRLADDALGALAERCTVFAKLTPDHKERIIKALRGNGHVVGFLGDGINDAPALRAADVGISVDSAVDIAKESADIILLEKSLLVLESGVMEGRRTFGNILKYIKMGASSNFGNVFSVMGASLLFPFLPMLPLQLLVQNLLYDLSQTAIPFDNVDADFLARPRKWEIGSIGRFMVVLGPISSIFDYATFAVLYFVFRANTPAQQSLFQSGWFVEGLVSQTLVVHMIRTSKVPFLQSRASVPLILSTLLIVSIGLYLPFSPLGKTLSLVHLPLAYFPYLLAILVLYAVLTQGIKNWFTRRFGFY